MTSHLHRRLPSLFCRRGLAVVSVLVCLLGGLALARGSDHAAARAQTPRTGLGRHLGADFVGFYVLADGTRVYCLNPRRATPRSVSLRGVARYPGVSASASAALGYALTVWGNARSRDAAAVESQVVNTLAGNHTDVVRRSHGLSASLRRLTAAHVRQALQQHGPYRLTLSLPAAPLPGQVATGTARLVSASGHPVAGVPVRLTASANVAVPGTVRTQRNGTVRFRYRSLDVGAARVRASVAGQPATRLRTSSPRPGEQRLVAAAPATRLAAAADYRAVPAGITHRYTCSSDCAGRPTVALSACAPAGTLAARVVYRVGSGTASRDVPAAGRRRCVTVTMPLADGTAVRASWQFETARGWSAPVAAAGSFVVDCPVPPAVGVTVGHDCRTAIVSVRTVAGPHPVLLTITGARRATVVAAAGRSASWSTTAPCGARLGLTIRGGAQRLARSWNMGPALFVRTP